MTKPTKDKPTKESLPKRCPICEGVLDLDGLCRGNYRCSQSVTHEQNIACMEVVKLVLGGKLAECEGQERIARILAPDLPF